MGKIGDLFVRLGVKNEQFKKGINEAKQETEGFGSKMKAVSAKAVAIWATIGAAATKVALDFVQSSQKLGDAWDRAMSRCKAGWSQFTNSLTQWNWEGFGQRMKNAMDAAANLTSVRDMTFEVQNAIDIKKEKMREELELYRRTAQDQTKTEEERAAAARKYLDTIKPIYDEELALREKIRNASSDKFLADAGVGRGVRNRDLLETFLTQVAPNGTLLNALEQYHQKNQGKNYKLTSEDYNIIEAFLANYEAKDAGVLMSLANYYQNGRAGKNRDEKVAEIVGDIKNYYAAEGAFLAETRRIASTESSMLAKVDGSPVNTNNAGTSESEGIPQDIKDELEDLRALREETEAVQAESDAYYQTWRAIHGLPPLDELIDPDLAEQIKQADENLRQFGKDIQKTEKYAVDLNEILGGAVNSAVQGFSDALQEMFDQLFEMGNMDGGAIFAALLKPLAETAKKAGEIMLAAGIGMTAFGEALKDPTKAPVLIAAGAALVAIGAAASAALSSLAATGGGASATSTTNMAAAGSGVSSAELTINVKGTIKGSDILISGSRTSSEWRK